MVSIELPGPGEMLLISDKEQGYYWSACADVIVNHTSWPGNRPQSLLLETQKHPLRVITRNTPWKPSENAEHSIAEGPINVSVLKRLGIEAQRYESESLTIQSMGGHEQYRLAYRKNLVREIPNRGSASSQPPFRPPPEVGLFNSDSLRYQVFTKWPGRYSPLFTEASDDSGRVIGLVSQSEVILGFPIFDVAAQNLTAEPLPFGYFQTLDGCQVRDILRLVFEHSSGDARSALQSAEEIGDDWDSELGNPLLTIRHDLDRPISDDRLEFLLSAYETLRLKSTWSIQTRVAPPPDQVKAILEGGHEINLHSCAGIMADFKTELSILEELYSIPIAGFTSHGGKGSAGNLGMRSNSWALLCRLEYGEIGGGYRSEYAPFIRIEGGIPTATPLIIPPVHLSFDKSMRDGDHYGEDLLAPIRQRVTEGTDVVLMNHPDIHTRAFLELLEALPHGSFTPATLREGALHFQATASPGR